MKAVITVTGKDNIGIIAAVSSECANYGVNISDISQSVLKDYFAMIMIANIDSITIDFGEFVDKMKALGQKRCLDIHTMHEDIFNSMHRI
ncbi:MAG: ACT domain-containing protein [Clostridia bacterium]|nr:ACT domain-containing protein [Clostridia bacterium]